VFYEILSEQKKYSLGFGLSNSQPSLNKKYTDYNLYPGFLNYNYHNQYIQIVAELGFVGLFFMLSLFLILLRQSILNKDYFLFYFILLTITVCFTESFLWRQRGMVFFITFALLLCKKEKINY
jgi:O-antigen ligase